MFNMMCVCVIHTVYSKSRSDLRSKCQQQQHQKEEREKEIAKVNE